MPIKYLVFTFLLANMKLPSHTPCLNVLCTAPSFPFSPIPQFSLPSPTAEQQKPGAEFRSAQQNFCPGRSARSGIGPVAARLPLMLPAPSLGRAQRRASPFPVSSCVPDPASSRQPHAHTGQKSKKSCEMFSLLLRREGESMNADNPRSCPPVAAGIEKRGCLAEGVNAEADPAPPALSQLCCISRLPRGDCHLPLLTPCPEQKLHPPPAWKAFSS